MRVRGRHSHIHTTGRIPTQVERRGQTIGFGSEQIDLKAVGHCERCEFFVNVGCGIGVQNFGLGPFMNRCVASAGNRPNPFFRTGDHRLELLPFFAEGCVAACELAARVVAEQ